MSVVNTAISPVIVPNAGVNVDPSLVAVTTIALGSNSGAETVGAQTVVLMTGPTRRRRSAGVASTPWPPAPTVDQMISRPTRIRETNREEEEWLIPSSRRHHELLDSVVLLFRH